MVSRLTFVWAIFGVTMFLLAGVVGGLFVFPEITVGFFGLLVGGLFITIIAILVNPQRIGVSPDGLTIVTRLWTRNIQWKSIGTPSGPLSWSVVPFQCNLNSGDKWPKFINVTKDQAVGILTHSSCPKWNINPKIWTSIGLIPPPQPSQGNVQS